MAYEEMWITDSRIMGKFAIFEIWKKKISMNFVAIIAIAVLTVALALVFYAYFLCRENLRRERKMNSVFYGLSKDLEGDTWRQKDTIQGQREEIESLAAEVRESKAMARMLRQRPRGSGELIAFTEKLLLVTDELANIYLESAAHPETLGRRVREVLDSTIANRGTFGPWMTDQDRQLVALMCCGISPNAVSVIMGMDMNRLSKWKTQLAKKMGSPVRLSKFLNEKLLDYSGRTVE